MCLVKLHTFPRISFKTLKVYKYGKFRFGGYITSFQETKFNLGSTIKAKKSIFRAITKGIVEGEGVHALYNCPDQHTINVDSYFGEIWFECEIPPFTPYYLGLNGDVAASKTKVLKLSPEINKTFY